MAEAVMADMAMLQAVTIQPGGMHDAARAGSSAEREQKLPLPASMMMVVLGSGGCWFVLTALTRWLFF